MFRTLCNPDIFRTLFYPPLWYILENKHIQNPTLWSILLRTLALYNYSILRHPIYWNIRLFRTRICQLLLNPFHANGLILYLLKTSENQRFSDVFRGYRKRPVAWNGLMYQLFVRTHTYYYCIHYFLSRVWPTPCLFVFSANPY